MMSKTLESIVNQRKSTKAVLSGNVDKILLTPFFASLFGDAAVFHINNQFMLIILTKMV